jgi:hypothetical protein
MKIEEITGAKPMRPKTPEQARIEGLKAAKERAAIALQAERQRQKMAKAQKAISSAGSLSSL